MLLLLLDRSDQEKHGAARFVLPCGMCAQQFWRGLRFGEPGNGETGVKDRIHIGGDSAVILDHLLLQKACLRPDTDRAANVSAPPADRNTSLGKPSP